MRNYGGLIAMVAASMIGVGTTCAQPDPMAEIRRSHIDANVPEAKDFQRILTRDLTKYVTDHKDKGISVNIELLRKEPTQSGVAFPKFYCWLQKLDAEKKVIEEAALRIAAVEKTRFDVIQYYTRERIVADPVLMREVFPKDVYEKIMEKVRTK